MKDKTDPSLEGCLELLTSGQTKNITLGLTFLHMLAKEGDVQAQERLDMDWALLEWLKANSRLEIPDEAGLQELYELRGVDLGERALEVLPPALGHLKALELLEIEDNGLGTLPEWLGELTQLKRLKISYNGLTTLPNNLRQLRALEWFDLNGNDVETLPEWLGELTQLRHLNISYNGLTALPDALKWLD